MNIRLSLLIAATCAVAAATGPVSDDFHSTTLNTGLWTFVNPLSDGSFQLTGTNLLLTVPAGTAHDLWAGGDNAVRVMQTITNVDFEVAVKFDSVFGGATQMQGVVVEQDATNFIRFEFLNLGGGAVHLFSASIINNSPSIWVDQPITVSSPVWLKVKRATNTWTISWSSDGNTYNNASSFTQGLTPARIGPYAANEVSGSSGAPAFTTSVDYFFNTASPLTPDMTITKSHTGNFTQGSTGSYTLTAINSGNGQTAGTVTVADTLPTGLTPITGSGTGWSCNTATQTVTCTRSDSLAGGSSYPAITLGVNVAANAPASVTNTATVAGGGETVTTNDSASDVTTINSGTGSGPDLTITKSHTGSFTLGGTGTYTITVTNSGAAVTSGTVTMSDPIPTGLVPSNAAGSGWSCGISGQTVTCSRSTPLAAGASYPAITLSVTISPSAPSSVTNTATVSGGGEKNTSNDSASDVTTIGSQPDLTIAKSHTGSFTQGGTGSYTITVSNGGGGATSSTVTMSDPVPAGLTPTAASGTGWTCGIASQTATCTNTATLAAAASYPAITLSVNVSQTAPSSVTNTATVSGGGETNTSNDSASDVTTIASLPDLTITKSHTGSFTQGGTGSYTITAKNSGGTATSGTVTVSDPVPAGLTPTAATGTGWTCGISSQTVTCTRTTALAAGASSPAITLSVNVSQTAPSSVTNTATVSGGGETNTSNDSASDVTTIGSLPDLTIAKSHTGSFTQGGTGSYTITVTNSGNAATSGTVTMSDVVPAGLTPTAATGTGWTCGISSQTVTCTRTTALAAGASSPAITLSVSVSSTAPSSVTNTATVSGGGETNTSNDSASDVTTITGAATPVSDDFHAQSLNTSLWTFVNPLGDGAFQMTGSNLLLIVPGGVNHDMWVGGNDSIHVTQPAPNGNFTLEAKFESAVTQQYQLQGILVEQDANNYLRFDVFSDGTSPHIFSAAIIAGNPTAEISSIISSGSAPFYMRVQRSGNNWTQFWSTDGVNYNNAGTYTQALTVARVGPYAGNSAPAPPFIGSVDYFFNTASPISPEDGGGVGITMLQATPTVGGGTVAWTTDRGASSQVKYGLTSSYGSSTTLDNTQVTTHSATLSGLTCGSTYHYSVTSTVSGGSSLSSPDATFVPLCSAPGQPVSDDFQSTTLNTNLWTFVNPLNDGSFSLDGTSLRLSVPAGINHDVWSNGDFGIRMMQTVADADLTVETKFTSAVDINAPYQEQGILVEQDATDVIRFSVNSSSLQTFLFVSTISSTGATIWLNQVIRGGANIIMRVVRSGNNWTFSYSYDSTHWTPALTFTQPFHVARIGPYAGNSGTSNNSPAFTAIVDYFVNRNAPPSTIDGSPYPPTPAPPVITSWYGDTQTFGQNGIPQQWVNILGDVADFDEISTLTYTLNGGAAQTLWMGENTVRLVEPGNFNVEIDYASLISGSNTVQITATDKKGRQTIHNVAITYVSGKTWPANYTINWGSAPSIQSVSQIVDGKWQIQSNGTVRTTQVGYDRLLALGDRTAWVNYTASANITFNSVNPAGFAVGIIVGWQGHTTVQYGVALPDQPRTGHPFPALGDYSAYFGPASLNIWENTVANPEIALASDTSGLTLQTGVAYTFKIQVTANTTGGSHFAFKVWPASGSEPTTWNLQADGAASQGSILLASHQADISIGNVTVTGN